MAAGSAMTAELGRSSTFKTSFGSNLGTTDGGQQKFAIPKMFPQIFRK